MAKRTKREFFNELLAIEAVSANEEMVAFIKNEIELLNKKSSGVRKPTATQVANEAIKENIKAVLADGKARTVSEVIASGDFADGTTTQKISALMTLLIKSGDVVKTVDKKKSYFSLAPTVSDDVDGVQALDRELAV